MRWRYFVNFFPTFSHFKSLMVPSALCLLVCLCVVANAQTQTSAVDEEETMALVAQSKGLRASIEKGLPQRAIASLKEEDIQRFAEFKNLIDDDSDKNFFNEVDHVIGK